MAVRSRQMYMFLFFSILVLSCLMPAGGRTAEPVRIGVLHWDGFPFATMMKNSFEMARDNINREGGINGRPVQLVYANDGGERKTGEKAVKDLIRKSGVLMIIGGYSSRNTIYTALATETLDIPFLITTAADDRITQRKLRNVYRLNPPAQDYAKGVEQFLLEMIKPSSMAIIYENSPYGTGGGLQMMWFCREHDIEIRKIIPYHRERAGKVYFQKLLFPLSEDPPDVLYMVSYLNDAVSMVRTIKELNLPSLLIGGAGGFTHQKFITMAGDASRNLLTATLWTRQLDYTGTKDYYNTYMTTHAFPPDYHGAEAYSGLLVAADALRRAKSLQADHVREALDRTNMETPFGPVKFQAYGKFQRQNRLPTMVLQVQDGTFRLVWPEDIAFSRFLPPAGWRTSVPQ